MFRREIASRLAQIVRGMSDVEAKRIIGSTDVASVVRIDEKHRRGNNAAMIWGFGVATNTSLPTLGQIHFGLGDKVLAVYGGEGTPFSSEQISEDQVRELLRLVHEMPVASGQKWNPSKVIDVVNALQPLGITDGLAIVDEYLRVTPPSYDTYERISMLLRVLHEVPKEPGHFPKPKFGGPVFGQPSDPALVPRFPVLIVDDIPLLLVMSYDFTGPMSDSKEIVPWFKAHGMWRQRPLTPVKLGGEMTVEDVLRKTRGILEKYLDEPRLRLTENMVRQQLMTLANYR